jgi:hypothetical protein
MGPEIAQDPLEARFDAAMLRSYEVAGQEVGYWATRYLQLVRRRGGLDAARYLLAQRVTSDGYARLREAHRLDLTVEALVLEPDYAPLFTPEELATASGRLEQFRAMPVSVDLEPSPELEARLSEAASAGPDSRIEHRDRIAAFGPPAIAAMLRWVDDGKSPGFAIAVLESAGRVGDRASAVAALHSIRARHHEWAAVAGDAISRVERGSSTRGHANGQEVRARGVLDEVAGPPPPAEGPCQFLTKAGKACMNPGR